ncbi:dihydroxyacetone kinase phosphoryl donor subunit DhaM [Tuberibacillus sp. Marseille-P3662]|uniref:dihydroxyacetone kinase phosphoryl donor subunit DhaM n=1 Tax=Tuberibacillus sp. Marseille-P3662 TaxID=1965358 RepID=UPI000A1CD3D6|nr:dihydroxyacetone kinase phosphoryl donor subunit DhaM [Tuberibacillus sp. Marseille-P3662]
MAHVGIVIVSHSSRLAEGVQELVSQTNQNNVPIAAAGGTDDGEIGTSVDRITKAITAVDEGAGVVVMFDIGSALMNAELAIEMLDNDAEHVTIADAPLVEGTYVAVVESGLGRTVEDVQQAAEKAKSWDKKQ